MTSSISRKRTRTKCFFCDRVNFVRNDYLKRLKHPYRCRFCFKRWRPETFEDKQRISIIHRKFVIDEAFFENINNETKSYWLGFLMADGAITENKIRICLNVKDKEHLLKWKREIGWNSGKKIFRVRYGGINQLRKIYCYLYDDSSIFLERKKSLFEDILNNYSFQLVSS